MNQKKTRSNRYLHFLLCFVLFILALFPSSALAAEETATKVVRVGWYEDSYHITGENGIRSGYGYEYEQAVAAYTGWDYEYVKGDWSELLSMLQEGKIDLMAAISYTDERAKTMLFSDIPMGEEKILPVCRPYPCGHFRLGSFYLKWQTRDSHGKKHSGNAVFRMGRKA